MRSDLSRLRSGWLSGCSLGLVLACGGGEGTGPPSGGDDADREAAAAGRAAQTSADFEQFVAGGQPDPVGALVASLQADSNVAQVERFDDDGTIIATLVNGVPFGISATEKDRAEWTGAASAAVASDLRRGSGQPGRSFGVQAASAPITCNPTNYPQSKRACLVRLFQGEFQQDVSTISAAVARAGFTPVSFPLKTLPDLASFEQSLSTCGVLYITSHGLREKNLAGNLGNHIVTEIEAPNDPNEYKSLRTQLFNLFGEDSKRFIGQTGHRGKAYFTLSPEFFASVHYPNTLVFADACSSAEPTPIPYPGAGQTPLREAFRANGAGAFLGWNAPISTKVSNPAAARIFDAMAPKVASIDAVTVTIAPPNPGAGQPYTPSAAIAPAQAGVEVSLAVRGTDGFTRDAAQTTDASGSVTFADVPGGQGGVIDTITVVAGGASNSATALNAVQGDPALATSFVLSWFPGPVSINALTLDAQTAEFNLVCNNQKLTQTLAVVKFSAGGLVTSRVTRR